MAAVTVIFGVEEMPLLGFGLETAGKTWA